MSYSHRQLLKTMFEFEIRNYIDIKIQKHLDKEVLIESQELANLLLVKQYIESRINDLK
jgi:hypothetical protein